MNNITKIRKNITVGIIALLAFLFINPAHAQLEAYLQQVDENTVYTTIRNKMFRHLDSLKQVMDTSLFYSGAGEYRNFLKFDKQWAPRLGPNGKFHDYFEKESNFYENLSRNYNSYTDTLWKELGPVRDAPGTASGNKGIGPIEFISIFDDGTPQSTQHMLAGSIPGGLFYSDNGGNNWVSGGTDTWDRSGVGSAVFHPTDPNTWYASSSGNGNKNRSIWIGKTGGIYRTANKGNTWEMIATHIDLGAWTAIYKIAIDTANANILYAVTNKGIFKTENANAAQPSWSKILNGRFFDLKIKPGNSNTLYAAGDISTHESMNWRIFVSHNKGLTWAPMANQPYPNFTAPGFDVTKNAITIEVSKAKPDYLYCHIRRNSNLVTVQYYDFATTNQWTAVGSHTDNDNFGDGHGFGVCQVYGDAIIVSYSIIMVSYFLYDTTVYNINPVHHDVEDVVFHPYQAQTVYIATHGGVEKADFTNWYSISFVPKYEGLGVGQVERMATSFTNPGYIIAGFDHDGTKLTDGNYTPDWETDWKVVHWGDGQQPLIDHKNPNNMWASAQQSHWRYSSDHFENWQEFTDPVAYGTSWLTTGELHKYQPNYFFRNMFSDNTRVFEEVYRSSDRGLASGENVYISNFAALTGYINPSTFVRKIVSSHTSPNHLLVNLLVRDKTGPNTWEDNHRLWRNNAALAPPQQALNAWQELPLPADNTGWIGDIAFHPDNHNLVYVLYQKSSGWTSFDPYAQHQFYLIDYTNPASPVFTDLTKTNFPNGVAGNMAILSGALGEVFVATDYGVFYTNDSLNVWQSVGKGLPNVSINGLEINFVNNSLRAGTYGKGVWEMPLPCNSFSSDLVISNNTSWNAPIRLDRNLRIAQGATLTIGPNAYVAMPLNANIKIEQGAHLVVDGGTISSGCDDYWGGIQVWGNENASQHALPGQLTPQGKLTLKNGATIENAWNAVTLWKPNDWNSRGGIVQASNTTFSNNKRSVEFLAYQNFNPIDTAMLMGNISYFKNCTFVVDNNFMIPGGFNSHITMWGVDGIKLEANNFSNNMTNAANRGNGIYTIDANFRVVPGCSQQIAPCPPAYVLVNTFNDLDVGIHATNARSSKTIFVDQAAFIGNGYGVKLDAVHNATIIRSQFKIGTFTKQGFACSGIFGVGIDITNSNGYIIEENDFNSRSNPETTDVIGIRVYYDPFLEVSPNDIYNNNFHALNRANLAEGKNFVTNYESHGLLYQCNTNTQNFFDFYFVDQGVAGKQGSLNKAAGNTFTFIDDPFAGPRHISNLADNHIDYYHTSGQHQKPLYIINVDPFLVTNAHGCPSSFGGGGNELDPKGLTTEQKQYFEQEMADNHMDYTLVQNLYASLLDGGNTEAVQADIAMAWPQDMWALRAELLGLSPLLSKEVLVSASDRTDVLPESIIFEVLAANPDELKKKELMEHLENKDNPLPEYMIQILKSLTGNVTYKTILQGQMAHHGRMENRAAGVLLRDMLNDSIRDEAAIRSFMAARQNLPMDMQIVDSYMESGETTDALALAAMLPQLYNLTGDALAEHGRFMELKQLQAGLHNQQRNIFQLTETEKTQLEGLVAESTGTAGMQARNILAFVYGNDYCDCPAEVEAGLKAKPATIAPLHKLHEPQIEARPNPASAWVGFTYTIPEGSSNALLEIRDTGGKLVNQASLDNIQGQYIWDTRTIASGLYHYTLKTSNGIKSGKVTIVK